MDYEAYFDEMLTTLSYRGLVVCSQYSPVVGLLKGGKYDAVQRDLHAGRRAVFEYLQNWFAALTHAHGYFSLATWRVAVRPHLIPAGSGLEPCLGTESHLRTSAFISGCLT